MRMRMRLNCDSGTLLAAVRQVEWNERHVSDLILDASQGPSVAVVGLGGEVHFGITTTPLRPSHPLEMLAASMRRSTSYRNSGSALVCHCSLTGMSG